MLITDKNELQKYTHEHRIWQGIPSIEVTKKGRIFSTFYSGGTKEDIDNFVMLYKSDDGKDFSELIAVLFKKDYRCYDPCLWIDPLGRLWFTWALMPEHATYAVICDDPDADELVWSEERLIGYDVMMNKPTVLSTGEWLFPIAVWRDGVTVFLGKENDTKQKEKFSFVYRTTDCGKTFEKIGGADVPDRSFDEHMVLELSDGRLAMFVRTYYGIGVSYSYDRGKNWTKGVDSKLIGPSSRFFIGRLPSGRVLFVNNDNKDIVRRDLTAFLSEDDGATWKYKLLLDEREATSYPDVAIGADGYLYVTYDRERGVLKNRFEDAYACAREILFAKITEEDIMAGKLTSPDSKLKCIISKLDKCVDEDLNPYKEAKRFTAEEYVAYLEENHKDEISDKIFEYYKDNCLNIHGEDAKKLDELTKAKKFIDVVNLVRVSSDAKVEFSIVDTVKKIITENIDKDLTTEEIARIADLSECFMESIFKAETATTINEYNKGLKNFLKARR